MPRISFVVPGKPQGKQRARRGRGGKWYTPTPTVRYESAVATRAMIAMSAQSIQKTAFPVEITVCTYFPDARRRDADNVLKSVCDGMNGVVYADDSQVVRATVTKAIDREHPRTEVTVWYDSGNEREA